MSASNDQLLDAIRDARRELPTVEIPTDVLESYLRAELNELDTARVRGALAASPRLREELLFLSELQDEDASARFAAASAPPAPSIRSRISMRRGRRLWLAWAAVLPLLLIAVAVWRVRTPSELDAGSWQVEAPLREDQFLPLRLRDGSGVTAVEFTSPRIAVTAALLECFEWRDGLRERIELPLVELERLSVSGLDGLACFDPLSRRLALLELPAGTRAAVRVTLPTDWGDRAVLVGWEQDEQLSYRARALGRWER